jgi:hypothetical protein
VGRSWNNRPDYCRRDVSLRIAFELEQLMKPDSIFVARPPGVGRNPPTRLDLAPSDEREDDIRIARVDG